MYLHTFVGVEYEVTAPGAVTTDVPDAVQSVPYLIVGVIDGVPARLLRT